MTGTLWSFARQGHARLTFPQTASYAALSDKTVTTLGRGGDVVHNIIVDSFEPAAREVALPTLTAEQREASLADVLRQWSGNDPVWVFAYGSLIWRPEFEYDAKLSGIVYGFHRSLCLWSRVYRGTPEQPGLVLGLEPGGCCRGIAFRLPAPSVLRELRALWAREMVTGSYQPRWLRVHVRSAAVAEPITAIAFVMDRNASGYAGELDRETLLTTLRTARGERGSSADYLLSTVKCLQDYGIRDRHLFELAKEVGFVLFDPRNLAI